MSDMQCAETAFRARARKIRLRFQLAVDAQRPAPGCVPLHCMYELQDNPGTRCRDSTVSGDECDAKDVREAEAESASLRPQGGSGATAAASSARSSSPAPPSYFDQPPARKLLNLVGVRYDTSGALGSRRAFVARRVVLALVITQHWGILGTALASGLGTSTGRAVFSDRCGGDFFCLMSTLLSLVLTYIMNIGWTVLIMAGWRTYHDPVFQAACRAVPRCCKAAHEAQQCKLVKRSCAVGLALYIAILATTVQAALNRSWVDSLVVITRFPRPVVRWMMWCPPITLLPCMLLTGLAAFAVQHALAVFALQVEAIGRGGGESAECGCFGDGFEAAREQHMSVRKAARHFGASRPASPTLSFVAFSATGVGGLLASVLVFVLAVHGYHFSSGFAWTNAVEILVYAEWTAWLMFMVLCPLARLNAASSALRVKLTEDSVGRAADRDLFCADTSRAPVELLVCGFLVEGGTVKSLIATGLLSLVAAAYNNLNQSPSS